MKLTGIQKQAINNYCRAETWSTNVFGYPITDKYSDEVIDAEMCELDHGNVYYKNSIGDTYQLLSAEELAKNVELELTEGENVY